MMCVEYKQNKSNNMSRMFHIAVINDFSPCNNVIMHDHVMLCIAIDTFISGFI